MKLDNSKLQAQAQGEAIIPRPRGKDLRLKIQATPLGWAERTEERMPEPRPPKETIQVKGQEPRIKVDLEDPGFLKAHDQHRARVNALVIAEALKADPRITFEAREGDDLGAFADAVLKELREAGFSGGDCQCLIQQIDALSNNTMEQIQGARDRFLSELRGEVEVSDGDSPTATE